MKGGKLVPSVLGTRNFLCYTAYMVKTSQKIINYIAKNGQASGQGLVEYLGNIGPRAVRKQLKSLLEQGLLKKIGRPPKVFYLLAKAGGRGAALPEPDKNTIGIINDRYLFITPAGEMLSGWEGFFAWCDKTGQQPAKTANEYIKTLHKYDAFRKHGFIDGMHKIKQTFKEVFLDKLFYLDFYSIERFGKTKLGQMLLYAKQSQDKNLMRQLIKDIRPQILSAVKKYKIDGVLFVPPTVKREVQIMKELEKSLRLPVKTLLVAKVKTAVAVPQKTLNKLEDRVENAASTIIVEDSGFYKNILLIDDAVGSGATLNETARQIRKKGLCKGRIIGLAITGSFKGFDVISEV